ncbi:MAG: hypothetical protein PUD92_07795 [Clostridiales bacterium]|nr:hypothetical protein [Clostridiales bacterium]
MKKQIISAICAVSMLTAVSAGFATVSAATPTEYVLTNNIKTDFDKSLYPGMECIDLGLSYDCNDNAFASDSLDEERNKLTSGNIASSAGEQVRSGAWDGPSAEIVADAKINNVYITGVDVYSWEAPNYSGINELKVSVSSDNENYSTPVTVGYDSRTLVYDKENDDNDLYRHTINFTTPINGRYIKIETSLYCYQQVIGEFVIRGYVDDSCAKILTKNSQNLYPSMSDLDIGLSYQIVSSNDGAKPEMVGNDPDCIKLTDGIAGGVDGNFIVYGGWDSDYTVTVIADAKTNVFITGADFFASGAKNVEISYSTDGANYTSLGTVTETDSKFSVNCAPKLARYIKFVSNRNGYQEIIREIVVKGYPAAFSFGGTKYDSTTNTFSGVLVNAPDVPAVASKVITAVYDADGRFVAAKTANVTVNANSSQSFNADFNGVTIGTGYKIKSYAWNSDNNYLTSPAEYIIK